MTQLQIVLDDGVLRIPYRAQTHEDGNQNFGYKSIVSEPEAIDRIPELENEQAMKSLVLSINSVDGTFETIRCLHLSLLLPDGKTYVREFVLGFVFREPSFFAEYSNCISFAGNLLERTNEDKLFTGYPPRLGIQKAFWRESGIEGWIMDLHITAIGKDAEDARQNLDTILPLWRRIFL